MLGAEISGWHGGLVGSRFMFSFFQQLLPGYYKFMFACSGGGVAQC